MKNDHSQEWITRAEHDYEAVQVLLKEKTAVYEIICFHCQQCIEKYLKAILTAYEIDFPKTHDLVKLSGLCLERLPSLRLIQEDLATLNEYAVAGRYPGEIVEPQDVQHAYAITTIARDILKKTISHNL